MAVQRVSRRPLRMLPMLVAVLGVLGARAAAAQQAAKDAVPVMAKVLTAAAPTPNVAPAAPLMGPRLTTPVASVTRPVLRDDPLRPSYLNAADSGGRQTVVISTLSLVLIVILIVLLI